MGTADCEVVLSAYKISLLGHFSGININCAVGVNRTTVTDTATSTAVVTSTVLVASTRLLSTVKTHTATSTHVTTATSTDTLTSTAIVTSVMVTISTGVSQIVSWVTYTTTALVTMTTTAIASITTTSTDIATSTLVTTETKTDTATLTTTRTDIASKTVYTTKTRTDVQTSTAVVSLTPTSTSTYATTKIATSTATLTETSTGVTTNTYTKTDTLTAISTSITTLVTTSIHLATSTQLLTSTKTETKTNTDTSTATTTTTHTHHTTETQVSTVRTTTVDTLSSTHVTTATITATKTQTTLATSTTVTTETDTQTKTHVMTSVETRTDKVTSTAMETATVMSTKVVTTCSANCPSATPTPSLTMTPPMLTSTTPPPERPPPSPACGAPADVAIVVHTSDSVSDEDFTSLKDFVAKIAGQYEVSQLGTHIGLITYSSTPKVEFSLNDERFYNPETIDSTIKALKVSGSGTRTDLALEMAYNKLFSAAGGNRDNKPNTLILVTDSRSDEGSKSFKDVVAPLLANHVRVIVVGVGKFIDYKELLLIADGKINSVIVTETFNDLNKNMEKVTNIACVQEESTPPQPASEATCDVKYRKVGCYGDKPTARAMPERLATSTPEYEAMGLANWLPKFVCDCARKAKDNNYFFFGVQDYGECWSGPEAGDTYDTYGASANCVDTTRGACVDASNTTCCGKENANYVYEIITEEPKPPTNTARITRTPPQIVYVTSGATARFVWEYVVDDREREFAEHSPKWWYYYESQRRVEIAYENKVNTWRWEISSNCPGNLKKRVSKDGMATLVISNVTSADMGTYGFSLELTSSDPLLSMVKLVVTEPPKPSPAPPPCKAVVDLAFLIDGSKSIEDAGKGNFKRCLDFVKRIALSFDISASGTHIGIVTFATDPTVELEFDQSFDNTSIATIIDNIRNPDALTFTGKALETVKKDLFEKSQRANVHHMLIVLTDGRSWDAVQEPAKQLKESGVTLYAVGVGQDYDLEQLKDIASNPDEDVFTAGFADLDTLVDKIRNKACNEALLPPPPPVNTARFTKMPDAVVYVTRGNTVKLVWEYTVDNREREFARYSPSWDFFNSQGQSSQIAYEDKENKWRWSVTSMTIPDRLQGRVSKEGQATLVIRDLTTEDNGVYGCSLVLMSGEPIVSKVEIFVTEPSVPITPAPVVAQFSLTPPKTVTVHEGETVKLKWDYTVTGDKNIVFSQYSPTWDIYDADGNGIELAHEDMYMGWYWSVSATCPWYLRDRISKEDAATLVISNAEITDSATYGCNLKLSSGKIITEKVQLIVQEKPKPNVRFTKVPERIVRLKSGQTVTLVWDYTYEGDKKDAFGPYSPTWNLYYGDGESVQLAYEEKSANWKWAVAYTCPEGLRTRISKAEKAALVIANLTTADSGQYGCSLMLATGAPLVDRMQLIVEDPPPPPEPPIDAYFTLVPSEIIYRYASKNVEFEWEYAIVGEKDKAFASHSPSWDLYAVNNQRTQLIYEDKEEGWRSHVASTCPARLKNRVSIKGQATLVIADLTVQDTGTYGCSLLFVTGKRIDSTVKLVVTDAPAPTATPSPATSPPCRASVDLVFLIDGSSSIEQFGKGNFLFCLNFVKRMAQSFEVSSSGTHVAVVLYYDSSKIVFNLNDYKTIDEVTGAVDKIKYPGGSTFTGAGLRMVKSEVFDKSGRSNVPHILIVMTDGESHDDVAEPSRVLREDNTIIYAVGEGYYFKLKQLNEMASEPKINHVFTADFGQMNTIVEDIKDKACSEISFPTQAPPKRPTAAPALPTVTETWATIIPISPTTAPCKVAVDLAFVLDGSTSINNADPGNFQLLKNFMINIVKSFKISSERTHVGLVLYSSFTQLKFNFDKYSDSASIVKAINTTDYPKGGTRTGEALKMAKSQLFGASMRSVPKVLIVLTDGRSSDKVEAPSKALKDEGVVIFAVGVGDQIDPSELNVMASDSKSDHVFKAKFKELDRLVDLIKRKACPDPEYNHYQITSQVDIAGSCPVKFTKVGCFNDDMKAPRPFPTMLFTDRDTESVLYSGTKFNAGQWNTYMPDVVCRCAVKAISQENIVFSIQNFGECWSGAKSENTYKIKGESDSCVSRDFKSCDVENNDLCVGNATKHFVYQIDFDEAKEVEACSSQYEVVGCYSDKHIANNRPFLTLLSTDVDPKSKVYSGIPVDKGNWNRYLPDAVCRCAQNAESSGFTHFGLQNYGECWSGYDADKTYDIDGESSECVGKNFKKPCNNNEVCVGDEATAESKTTGMYVYRLRKEANGMGIYRKRSSLAYQRYRLHGNRKIKREVARHGHKSHKLRGKRRRTNK
ncbi:uncharacterized protein LOC5512415 isoform X2 [Nematostella vectensis]|uniref:uncharacterized protein LOC5512415 isoform X2 n=1 Tax=Nematostella vectensis TaxID=45351 RepID=UPI0020775A64|nr:uncharacterized protein LOC5512415 isoform X2 [Nematostella vectensis]